MKVLEAIRELMQEDVGKRGLASDPAANLLTACAGDFAAACRSIAAVAQPVLGIVTGFFIPHAQPPGGETDGPLGALFLARALVPLGMKIVLATDAFCVPALAAGLAACDLDKVVRQELLPPFADAGTPAAYRQRFAEHAGPLTHLIALERVGPSHTLPSLQSQLGGQALGETYLEFLHEVPEEHQDRCHTMRGRDITEQMSPAHWLFEPAPRQQPPLTTIGIGDGGNEIGMGKIPWEIIRRNIPGGARLACRVPVDHLIVCGISNWGAYALAAGIRYLRGRSNAGPLFNIERERQLLALMVERGPLVDGVSGLTTVSVDGIPFDRYAEKLRQIGSIKLQIADCR
jgi:hypothetical protein